MDHLIWYHYLIFFSFLACVAGLCLLISASDTFTHESETTEQMLFKMTFTYWMVYCLAIAIQKIELPIFQIWEVPLMSLKLTAVIAYVLTFTCAVTLPLHRLATLRRVAK
ncbi:MAG: hypothetical protein VKJ46_13555 [Leptolyngbyaceae bacterium]|nr:hypothetical protein [Leptolyngbyaceae bacterium]